MESNAIHILIVEDLTLTRMGIRTALNNSQLNCQIVAEAGTLREAKQQLAQNPDIQLVLPCSDPILSEADSKAPFLRELQH